MSQIIDVVDLDVCKLGLCGAVTRIVYISIWRLSHLGLPHLIKNHSLIFIN